MQAHALRRILAASEGNWTRPPPEAANTTGDPKNVPLTSQLLSASEVRNKGDARAGAILEAVWEEP